MNWSELKLHHNELAHNSHRLIPKDSHINNFIHCYFLFKVSECPVHHKANSLDLPLQSLIVKSLLYRYPDTTCSTQGQAVVCHIRLVSQIFTLQIVHYFVMN